MPIFKYLMDHITQPEFVIRLKWTPGMLTIWDNRRMFHMAMNDYHGHRRHMQRVIVQGLLLGSKPAVYFAHKCYWVFDTGLKTQLFDPMINGRVAL